MVVSVVPTEKGVDVICLDNGAVTRYSLRKSDLCVADVYGSVCDPRVS